MCGFFTNYTFSVFFFFFFFGIYRYAEYTSPFNMPLPSSYLRHTLDILSESITCNVFEVYRLVDIT